MFLRPPKHSFDLRTVAVRLLFLQQGYRTRRLDRCDVALYRGATKTRPRQFRACFEMARFSNESLEARDRVFDAFERKPSCSHPDRQIGAMQMSKSDVV